MTIVSLHLIKESRQVGSKFYMPSTLQASCELQEDWEFKNQLNYILRPLLQRNENQEAEPVPGCGSGLALLFALCSRMWQKWVLQVLEDEVNPFWLPSFGMLLPALESHTRIQTRTTKRSPGYPGSAGGFSTAECIDVNEPKGKAEDSLGCTQSSIEW